MAGHECADRIDEAIAEAAASVAVKVVYGVVWRFFHVRDLTWGEVLEDLSWAAAEGDRARMRGWSFLDERAT